MTIEHDWLQSRDSVTLDRILARDFLHPVAKDVVLTKDEQIAWAVQHPIPLDRRSRIVGLGVRFFGSTAVAIGSVVTTDTAGHETARNLFTDVFVYRDRRWQAVSAQETGILH